MLSDMRKPLRAPQAKARGCKRKSPDELTGDAQVLKLLEAWAGFFSHKCTSDVCSGGLKDMGHSAKCP